MISPKSGFLSIQSMADAVLQATWNLASIGVKPLVGTVGITLNVKDPAGRFMWSSIVVGKESGTGGLGAGPLRSSLNSALASAMAQIGPLFEGQDVVAKIFPPTAAVPAAGTVVAKPAMRSDIDELPTAKARPQDKAHAVVIGIRRYQQGLPEADFADSDAGLMKTCLTQALGYQDANVASLINEQATKSGFEKFFESWLPNRVGDGDDVFVYFSGHGAPNPRSGDAYMVPYDGDPTYLDKTGYPLKRLYSELAKLPAKRVTVVMDSCFSGAGGRSVLAKGARPLVMVAPTEGIPEKLTVLSAAAGDQISYAYQEKGHGLFTYFLLKGIKEKGSGDMRAVYEYAAKQVSNVARREYNADQVPQWRGKP